MCANACQVQSTLRLLIATYDTLNVGEYVMIAVVEIGHIAQVVDLSLVHRQGRHFDHLWTRLFHPLREGEGAGTRVFGNRRPFLLVTVCDQFLQKKGKNERLVINGLLQTSKSAVLLLHLSMFLMSQTRFASIIAVLCSSSFSRCRIFFCSTPILSLVNPTSSRSLSSVSGVVVWERAWPAVSTSAAFVAM